MVKIEIELTPEEWVGLQAMAEADTRSPATQVRHLIKQAVKRRVQAKEAIDARWAKHKNTSVSYDVDTQDTDVSASIPVVSERISSVSDAPPPPQVSPLDGPPPSPWSSPTPPSNPSTSPPIIPPSFPTPSDFVPFSEPLEGPAPDELPESRDTSEKPSAEALGEAEPQTEGVRAAPKPSRRHVYTPAFEKFWKAYPGGGDKQEAFKEWKAAGLERDDELREMVGQALQAQIEDQKKCLAAGQFWPAAWKDAERWLKGSCWENKLRYEAPQHRPPSYAPTRPVLPNRNRPMSKQERTLDVLREAAMEAAGGMP